MQKPWYKSKTIIVALLQAIGGIIVAFMTEYPQFGALAIVKSVVDISLRFVTESSVS